MTYLKKPLAACLFMLQVSGILQAQIIPATISVSPNQTHNFVIRKTNMALSPISSTQNPVNELYCYNGGVGYNYDFFYSYFRYKFTHPNISNSDITDVSYSFTYGTHNDINYPTQPNYWSTSKLYVVIPQNSCNVNYWGSYALSDCVNAETCIVNTSAILSAAVSPNGAGPSVTLTQSQAFNSTSSPSLGTLLQNSTDFTIDLMPDQNALSYLDIRSVISAQITYNTYPITNNSISSNQSYTGSGNPTILTGTNPTGGNRNQFSYQWQSSTDNTTWSNISGATAASYDPPVINQTTYYRRVVSSAPQPSSISNVVTVTILPPLTPVSFDGYAINNTSSLYLYWTASSGATSYDIFSCSGTLLANVAAPATNYMLSGLSYGTLYDLKITARNPMGSSPASPCVQRATFIDDVSGIAYNTNCNQLTISWNPVAGATKYYYTDCTTNISYSTPGTSITLSVPTGRTVSYAVNAEKLFSGTTITSSIHANNPICNPYTVPSVSGSIATPSSNQLCPGTTSIPLNLSGYNGAIQWQSSVCNAAYQNIAGATSSSYLVTSAAGTGTSFRAKVSCGSYTEYTSPKVIAQYNVCNPPPQNIPSCGGGGGGSRMAQSRPDSESNPSITLKLYPNPAIDQVTIEFASDQTNLTLKVYDLMGKVIYQSLGKNTDAVYRRQLDVSDLNRGVYLVEINDQQTTRYQKLILN